MAALAFKAIDYGADRIPDKFFESIPGGFFTPPEKKKKNKTNTRDSKRDSRPQSEHRDRDRRQYDRDRTPPTDYSDHSAYDTNYEREYKDKLRRRRAKSVGVRSLSRGRHTHRDSDLDRDLDGEYDQGVMERAAPAAEYKPYNPADYAGPPRAQPGYAPQPLGSYPQLPISSSAAARYTPAGVYAANPADAPIPPPNPYPAYNPADYASPPPTNYSPNPGYKAPGNAFASPPPFYRQQSRSQPSLAEYPYPDNTLTYNDAPSRHDSTSSSRHRRHGDGKRHRARSAGHRKRSRSRVADQFRDRFDSLDQRERGLAASVGGALAGGLAGRAVGRGTLSTLVGAAIGGFGGSALEKRHEKKKASRDGSTVGVYKERNRSRHDDRRKEEYSRSPTTSPERQRSDRYDGGHESYSDSDSDYHRGSRRRRSSRRETRRDDDY